MTQIQKGTANGFIFQFEIKRFNLKELKLILWISLKKT